MPSTRTTPHLPPPTPRHRPALLVHLAAHEAILADAADSFDELGYLESEITRTQRKLDRA